MTSMKSDFGVYGKRPEAELDLVLSHIFFKKVALLSKASDML